MKILTTLEDLGTISYLTSLLSEAGIKAITSSDDCAGLRPSMQLLIGTRILVSSDDFEKAQEILGGIG